jgi:hypothetical protein
MTLTPANPKHQWYYAPKQALATAESLAASLGEADRKAPACITGNTNRAEPWQYTLVPDGTAACHRIVEPNLGLFDNKLPRTAIQLVVVKDFKVCLDIMKGTSQIDRSYPGGCPGTVKLAGELDWQRLVALFGR